jgi:hypothetical protein
VTKIFGFETLKIKKKKSLSNFENLLFLPLNYSAFRRVVIYFFF